MPPILIDADTARALTKRRLAELDRLNKISLAKAESLGAVCDDLSRSPEHRLRVLVGSNGVITALERVMRSVRQIVVLEFELLGLFNAPDRDAMRQPRLRKVRLDDLNDLFEPNDLNDRDYVGTPLDYRTGPMAEVVADIRKTLGVEAPADDPFASCAERKTPERRIPESGIAPPRQAESPQPACARKPAMQTKPVVKAKAPALPRTGFRVKPTSPHNPNTPSGARKGRHNRGPPR
jgi:hypothetical protein